MDKQKDCRNDGRMVLVTFLNNNFNSKLASIQMTTDGKPIHQIVNSDKLMQSFSQHHSFAVRLNIKIIVWHLWKFSLVKCGHFRCFRWECQNIEINDFIAQEGIE